MEREQQEVLTKQSLCANLNTYVILFNFAYAEGWAFSLVETMCQHRKSELLYFLSVISSGVNLPHGGSDVELCNCTVSLHWPLSAGPGTDNSYCTFCFNMDFWESTFLSEASSHLMGLDLSIARSPGIYVSLRLELKCIVWGSLYNSGSLAKIILHGKIVLNSVFQLSGNNSVYGRRESQDKVVRRKVYMILQ